MITLEPTGEALSYYGDQEVTSSLEERIAQVSFSCFAFTALILGIAASSRRRPTVLSPSREVPPPPEVAVEEDVRVQAHPQPVVAERSLPPPLPSGQEYQQLPCSEEHQRQVKNIVEVSSNAANTRGGLIRYGAQLAGLWNNTLENHPPLHPFKFLSIILKEEGFPPKTLLIKHSNYLWGQFLGGVQRGMLREKNGIDPLVEPFYDECFPGCPERQARIGELRDYIQRDRWEEMTLALMRWKQGGSNGAN